MVKKKIKMYMLACCEMYKRINFGNDLNVKTIYP